jgi:hypothetical protein
MDPRTFAVERLGVGDWPATATSTHTVIPLEGWKTLADPGSAALDPVSFAFDAHPSRTWAAIGVAGERQDGLMHVELVDHRRGMGWLADRIAELDERHDHIGFRCDGKSPAATLIPELEQRGVNVETLTTDEFAQACGTFYDHVDQERLRHLGQPGLLAALKGARARPLGDRWAWGRKESPVDVSPLAAATVALWASATTEQTGAVLVAFA